MKDGTARKPRPRGATFVLCAALLAAAGLGHAQDPAAAATDPWQMPLEDLLEVKVFGASRYLQETAKAPASVSIITADEIRAYGHQTLADVLNSVRGVFVDYDRNYSYVGVRGFERPGDYNSRVLLLVDGFRLNEPVYDNALVGTEFPIDIAQIERIEVIRGPGSSVYGSNAFFGVVNIVTRHGSDVRGAEAGVEAGSFGSHATRITLGDRDDSGLEWLLAANRYGSEGQDHYYPAFDAPETNNGLAQGLDGDHAERYLAKLSYGQLAVVASYGSRSKDVPTASYGTVFNPPFFSTVDTESFLDLSYTAALGGGWTLLPRLFNGSSHYHGDYPADYGDGLVLNHDASEGRWWGSELRLDGIIGAHHLQAGAEYQRNRRQDQYNYDVEPYALYTDDHRSGMRHGVFIQDEWAFAPGWLLNGGLRFDHYSTGGDALSPRAGLLWQPSDVLDLKLLYGRAFRAPNAYELFYYNEPQSDPLPGPETTTGYELIADYRPAASTRYTLDLYYNKVRDLIGEYVDPDSGDFLFRNIGAVDGHGLELEYEHAWSTDHRLRLSYAVQDSDNRDTGTELANSPRHMAQISAILPLAHSGLHLGAEVQYLGQRHTWNGAAVPDRTLANLTLTTREWHRLELAGGVRNLLDRGNADPGRPEHLQDVIPMDGRAVWLQLTYHYH